MSEWRLESMKKLFAGDREAMAQGYVEMAEINLQISEDWFFVEHEGRGKIDGMDATEGENKAQ